MTRQYGWLALLILLLLLPSAGCAAAGSPAPAATPGAATSAEPAPSCPTACPPPSTSTSTPPTPGASTTPNRESSPARTAPPGPSLVGDRRNQVAFAPVNEPSRVTVEGRVSPRQTQAWSTSKVLVVAAYLDTAVEGDPTRLSRGNRQLIEAALTRSDADAVVALRDQIRGRPGLAMTRVLRSIGDRDTVAPDQSQGLMLWSAREQVRFMAALANGKVVSKAASAYLLEVMRPVREHAWGLGTIGASAFKGGWLRADTSTRQMGLVDGFAVAIITDGVGPAVRQSDGDDAHVRQMNRLALLLRQRLDDEQKRR